jgi:MinD superfamily P-loop ATPase
LKIAIASGKGGTGKTTVAVSLAMLRPETARYLDCDVEAPNAHLFLHPVWEHRQDVGVMIPKVDEERCDACRRCMEVCQFNAITVMGSHVLVFPELCHGCGGCQLVCPTGAIEEVFSPIGWIERGTNAQGLFIAQGVLSIGQPMATPIIGELKKKMLLLEPQRSLSILDAPPGASCPVVETLRGTDYVLLVTEPTPFGLHDLKLAAEVVRALDLPAGVILNRVGIGQAPVEDFCHQAGLPILLQLPMRREIAAALAQGQVLIEAFPEFRPDFENMLERLIGDKLTEGSISP